MRGEVDKLPEDLTDGLSAEKQQEQMLMNKLAATGKLPARPASSFLQKKLQQRKFFDSGDYAMDKDRAKQDPSKPHPLAVAGMGGGAAGAGGPKPSVPTSIAVSAAPPAATSPASPEAIDATNDDGLTIPRPDNVPQRKASIINPNVGCKLSPQPHVHHEVHHEES